MSAGAAHQEVRSREIARQLAKNEMLKRIQQQTIDAYVARTKESPTNATIVSMVDAVCAATDIEKTLDFIILEQAYYHYLQEDALAAG